MVNREEFENLFVFLTNHLRDYGRIIFEYDQFVDDFYIQGNYLDTIFTVDSIKGGISLSLKNSDDLADEYLSKLIEQFRKEKELVSYSIVDINGCVGTTRVHEWTNDLDRINELKSDKEDRYPFKITDLKYDKKKIKVKQLKR